MESLNEADAVEAGHADIGDDDVEAACSQRFESGQADPTETPRCACLAPSTSLEWPQKNNQEKNGSKDPPPQRLESGEILVEVSDSFDAAEIVF